MTLAEMVAQYGEAEVVWCAVGGTIAYHMGKGILETKSIARHIREGGKEKAITCGILLVAWVGSVGFVMHMLLYGG
jgi:hypothetical protein